MTPYSTAGTYQYSDPFVKPIQPYPFIVTVKINALQQGMLAHNLTVDEQQQTYLDEFVSTTRRLPGFHEHQARRTRRDEAHPDQ